MDTTMMPQSMGTAPFYFYNSESKQQQSQQQQHKAMYPMVPTLPSTPMYSRPGSSSCSRPPTLYSNGPSVMTPTGSPPPTAHKPAIMLETDFGDNPYFPSTPPLSTSGSAVGSPKSCEVLQTPMNPMFSGIDGLNGGFKDSLDSAENAVLDWSNCGSPPMTPVYLQQFQAGKPLSLNPNTIDLLSIASCPSLSPSPTPYARSIASDHDVDFCDPRNLTVSSVTSNPTLAPEFTLLGDDDVNAELCKSGPTSAPQPTFDFNPTVPDGLPSFDDFSDLESEEDFNNLVNLEEHTTIDVNRPRACTGSSVVSLGHGSFIGEDDLCFDENDAFQFPSMSSPPSSVSTADDSHKDKRRKKSNNMEDRTVSPIMDTAATSETQSANDNQESNKTTSNAESTEPNASSDSDDAPTPALPAPTNRRGRKQSLTEDPSKTFVCELCNRRFRRQEHLKRHYRSLHTHDKPFGCSECGKTFSRSDNLAQHARTHSGGAIVMNLIEDGDMSAYDASMMSAGHGEDYSNYGKVLFQIASEVPGSASEQSSDDDSEHGKKKRKRSD